MKAVFIFCGLMVCSISSWGRQVVSSVIDGQRNTPETVDIRSAGETPQQSDAVVTQLRKKIGKLPLWKASLSDKTPFDWLLTPENQKQEFTAHPTGKALSLPMTWLPVRSVFSRIWPPRI